MRKFISTGCLLASLTSGCSHIPDPAAVPGVEPYVILQNIRCEIAHVLARDYPKQHTQYQWVRKSDIAYGLTLRAEERNASAGKAGFLWPIHLGTFKLDASAGHERFRSGEGVVNLAEELKSTLTLLKTEGQDRQCAFDRSIHVHSYPILGTIGMDEVIRRFVEVNSIASTAKTNPEGEGKFQHLIKFKLKFLGGIKPSFAIERLDGRKLSGELDLSAHREDIHELIIGMAPPKPGEVRIVKENGRERIETIVPPGRARSLNQRRLLESIERQQDRQRFRDDLREELQR